MTNNPKEPFNTATDRRKAKGRDKVDLSRIRDKDNVEPRLKPPAMARYPARNKAPIGVMGIQVANKELLSQQKAKRIVRKDEIKITKGDPEKDLFIYGTITSMPGYSFIAKVYDLPSDMGIDGGSISKLEIRKDGEIVALYNEGWKINPRGPENKEALDKIKDLFDGPERVFTSIAPPSKNKGHSHER